MRKLQVKVGVGVLILNKNQILLGKRIDGHNKGTWQSAGGHLEFGESFEKCAQREIKEEIGIKVKNIRYITVTNDIFTKEHKPRNSKPKQLRGKHYVTVFLVCEYDSGTPKPLEPKKCNEWKWFDKNNLPKRLFLRYDKILLLIK